MFDSLAETFPKPRGCPERAWRLDVLRRVLDGSVYDKLPYEFHTERNASGEYVPLRRRKPSVRYNLCRLVVDDSISFLFGEGRFPAIECQNKPAQEALASVLFSARVMETFTQAALVGSVGSVVIRLRILRSRVFLDVMPTMFLTPEYDPEQPDMLLAVHEAYQVKGADLRSAGYGVADRDLATAYWYRRTWTSDAELWFLPQRIEDADKGLKPRDDPKRTVRHNLGFVPIVWVRNLPGGIEPDGACTFRAAIETNIEIDYQLSQAGRGLKYSSDPTLLIKEPAAADAGGIVRSASEALIVSEKGDAKLLEIGGSAVAAVIEYVRSLRELALESIHGNRANADRVSAAQSGRAMEMLYAALLNLVDRLRSSYGRALLDMANMIVRASAIYPVQVEDVAVSLEGAKSLTLRWPPFFAPTPHDMQTEAGTLGSLRREGLMSQDTAVRRTAATHDVGDADAELKRIQTDEAEADARAARQNAQIQDKQSLPA